MIKSVNKLILISVLIFTLLINTFPQNDNDSVSTEGRKIDYWKLGAISGITLGGIAYVYTIQKDVWWKGEKSSFHFEWSYDWTYALGSDKFGHFYFPYVVTHVYSQLLEWSGLERWESLWYSASFAWLYQTFVEIRDGFSADWGFSWGDFGANTLGAAYPLLQEKYPYLKNYHFKISFYPSKRFREGSHRVIFDDYESTYNWLSINVHNLLPDEIQKYYPPFINLAIGHSVKKLKIPSDRHHELFLALDWNLEGLPGDGWFWNLLKKNLNFYRIPAPAVKIYPGVVWYGLKF